MKYPGAELETFDKATIWRKYIFLQIKEFIKGSVLEVGAGIGSFTNNYKNIPHSITLSEIDDYNYKIGKAIKLRNGNDIAIVACGTRVRDAIDAVDLYYENFKKKISVYNFHTIKPIDKDTILEMSKKYRYILSFEEHNIIGGLSSSISEVLATLNTSTRLFAFGIPDLYPKGGEYHHIF